MQQKEILKFCAEKLENMLKIKTNIYKYKYEQKITDNFRRRQRKIFR